MTVSVVTDPDLTRMQTIEIGAYTSISFVSEEEILDQFLSIISKLLNVSVEDIIGGKQDEKYVFPRRIFSFYAVEHTNMSLGEIAKKINRTHATVIWHHKNTAFFITQKDKHYHIVKLLDELLGKNTLAKYEHNIARKN